MSTDADFKQQNVTELINRKFSNNKWTLTVAQFINIYEVHEFTKLAIPLTALAKLESCS